MAREPKLHVISVVFLSLAYAPGVWAQQPPSQIIWDNGYYSVATQNAFASLPTCNGTLASCWNGTNSTYLGTANGAQVDTSDYTAGLYTYIAQATAGESFTF
jgi:hypothetical protein